VLAAAAARGPGEPPGWVGFAPTLGGHAAARSPPRSTAGANIGLDLGAATWAADGALKAAAGVVLTFAAASLAIGVGTAAPYRTRGMASDGKRLLTVLRPGAVAERHAALVALGAWLTSGTAPRDWDPAVVARVVAAGDDGSLDAVLARYLAYLHALDREDPARRGTILARCAPAWTGHPRASARCFRPRAPTTPPPTAATRHGPGAA
jgi:hypothetical protein